MRRVFDKIWEGILWIWQLPQNLLATILLGFFWAKIFEFRKTKDVYYIYFDGSFFSPFSLGQYIFMELHHVYHDVSETERHEYGHCIQSKYLGWLYIPVIAIPSVLHLCVWELFGRRWNYYDFYTEKWADKLGGVAR